MTERPDAASPSLDEILRWLSAEAGYWKRRSFRKYQTNLIHNKICEWRDTGKEPKHGLD